MASRSGCGSWLLRTAAPIRPSPRRPSPTPDVPRRTRSSITHWINASPMTGARSSKPVAASTRSRTSAVGRGVMRSTIEFGHDVLAIIQSRSAVSPRSCRNSSMPALKTVAVAAQVVAVLQRDLAGVLLHARIEDRGERAVDRRAGALEVGGEVGVRGVELVVFVEVIAAFGHGERRRSCIPAPPLPRRALPGRRTTARPS